MAFLYRIIVRSRNPVVDYKLFFALPLQFNFEDLALSHMYEGAEFVDVGDDTGRDFPAPEEGEVWFKSEEIRDGQHLYRVDEVVEISAETQAMLKQLKII